jgi:hypothetical protein
MDGRIWVGGKRGRGNHRGRPERGTCLTFLAVVAVLGVIVHKVILVLVLALYLDRMGLI